MKLNATSLLALPCAMLAGSILLIACATRSPPPRLYVFASHNGHPVAPGHTAEDSAFLIYLTLPRLSAYLDRPQMVTRLSNHEIEAAPFHRWGIPLDIMIRELLASTLYQNLPEAYVEATARRTRPGAGYQVQTNIIRLDGIPGGEVELIAQLEITRVGEPPEPITKRLRHYKAMSKDTSYAAYADAVRKTVQALGAEISEVIAANQP